MNSKTAKNIRKYVKLKLVEEQLPASEFKKLYKVFKNIYEEASPEIQKKYDQDMQNAFNAVTPSTT